MNTSSSPYRDLYKGSTFLAVGDVHDVQKEELERTIDDFGRSGIRLRHVPALTNGLRDEIGASIREVFILRQEGGIVDQKGRLITLSTRERIERFLAGGEEDGPDTPDLNAAGRQALRVARDVLDAGAGRAAIISPALVRREVDEWQGAGTLLYDEHLLHRRPIRPEDKEIVRYVMRDLIAKKHFRERPGEEEELLRHHHVLDAKGILGGASLLPWQDGDYEFARLWTGHIRNGLGCEILTMVKDLWGRQPDARRLFALTKFKAKEGEQSLYEKRGFELIGQISGLRDDRSLPPQVRDYDTPARDPFVYVYRKSQ